MTTSGGKRPQQEPPSETAALVAQSTLEVLRPRLQELRDGRRELIEAQEGRGPNVPPQLAELMGRAADARAALARVRDPLAHDIPDNLRTLRIQEQPLIERLRDTRAQVDNFDDQSVDPGFMPRDITLRPGRRLPTWGEFGPWLNGLARDAWRQIDEDPRFERWTESAGVSSKARDAFRNVAPATAQDPAEVAEQVDRYGVLIADASQARDEHIARLQAEVAQIEEALEPVTERINAIIAPYEEELTRLERGVEKAKGLLQPAIDKLTREIEEAQSRIESSERTIAAYEEEQARQASQAGGAPTS